MGNEQRFVCIMCMGGWVDGRELSIFEITTAKFLEQDKMIKNLLRIIFSYRKYSLANKILKQCCNVYGYVSNMPDDSKFLTEKEFTCYS